MQCPMSNEWPSRMLALTAKRLPIISVLLGWVGVTLTITDTSTGYVPYIWHCGFCVLGLVCVSIYSLCVSPHHPFRFTLSPKVELWLRSCTATIKTVLRNRSSTPPTARLTPLWTPPSIRWFTSIPWKPLRHVNPHPPTCTHPSSCLLMAAKRTNFIQDPGQLPAKLCECLIALSCAQSSSHWPRGSLDFSG